VDGNSGVAVAQAWDSGFVVSIIGAVTQVAQHAFGHVLESSCSPLDLATDGHFGVLFTTKQSGIEGLVVGLPGSVKSALKEHGEESRVMGVPGLLQLPEQSVWHSLLHGLVCEQGRVESIVMSRPSPLKSALKQHGEKSRVMCVPGSLQLPQKSTRLRSRHRLNGRRRLVAKDRGIKSLVMSSPGPLKSALKKQGVQSGVMSVPCPLQLSQKFIWLSNLGALVAKDCRVEGLVMLGPIPVQPAFKQVPG